MCRATLSGRTEATANLAVVLKGSDGRSASRLCMRVICPQAPAAQPMHDPPSANLQLVRALSDPIGRLATALSKHQEQGVIVFPHRAADLEIRDVETALVHGAVGDYADEAAVLRLVNFGHWVPQLQSAELITLAPDVDGEGIWAQVTWPDIERALASGRIAGSSREVRVLCAASSIAEGHPVDLGDLVAGLDRHGLTLLLAAIAHAAGSHDHRELTYGSDGVARPGATLPPLVAWPPTPN